MKRTKMCKFRQYLIIGARSSTGRSTAKPKSKALKLKIEHVVPTPKADILPKDWIPTSWEDVERWIISKCESYKSSNFSENVRLFIKRLEQIRDGISIAPTTYVSTESLTDIMMKNEPSAQKGLNEVKHEEDEIPSKRTTRGRPRKSVIGQSPAANLLTDYFTPIPPPTASPSVDPGSFSIS